MTRVAVLLRAVNVGGRGRLEMSGLRAAAEAAGATEASTLLASGNLVAVVPDGDAGRWLDRLAATLDHDHDLRTELVLLTAAEVAAVIASCPFPTGGSGPTVHVMFFPDVAPEPPVDTREYAPERVAAGPRWLYLQLPDGVGRSRLARTLARAHPNGTMRNWRTVTALADRLVDA